MGTRKARPSAATLVATSALVLALSGVAIAAPEMITKETVKKIAKQEAKKQVNERAPAIADERIAALAPGLTVAKAASADSAATAGSAASADSAASVGGLRVIKFARTGNAASPVDMVELGGLQLRYLCPIAASPFLQARTTVDGASLFVFHAGGNDNTPTFNTATPVTIAIIGAGTGVYSRPSGEVVSFNFRSGAACSQGIAGTAYGG